jgi:flagellar assembly factor FliW
MQLQTNRFGEIEIEEDKVIEFVAPILGFEDYKKFTIIDSLDDEVFYWLQSLEENELSFTMVNPLEFVENYEVGVNSKAQDELGITEEDDIIIYTLVTVRDEGAILTTNLKAPVIINADNKKAGQIVLEKDYPTRYCLWQEETEEVSG